MPRRCQVTGKKSMKGRSYTKRGIAKKKKGIGLNVTGITKRRFLPNLMKKRFWYAEEKRFVSLRLSANAMRTIEKNGLHSIICKMRAEGAKV